MRAGKFLQLMGVVVLAGMVGCSTTPKDADVELDEASANVTDTGDSVDSSTYEAPAGTTAGYTGNNIDAQDDEAIRVDHQNQDAELLRKKIVYFDFDQSLIKPDAYDALKAHARRLVQDGTIVRLEGHADERGTREYNLALGERRGKAVAKFLRINGVSSRQLEVVSYGEEKPDEFDHNESAWSKNRRVEINYK